MQIGLEVPLAFFNSLLIVAVIVLPSEPVRCRNCTDNAGGPWATKVLALYRAGTTTPPCLLTLRDAHAEKISIGGGELLDLAVCSAIRPPGMTQVPTPSILIQARTSDEC